MELIRRSIALACACALAATPAASVADAAKDKKAQQEAMAEARTRYERGLKLYSEGAYEAALVEMQRAYELAPTFKILYNLGLVHRQLHDFAAALDAFRRYLAEGEGKVPAAKRAEVEKWIGELEKAVASVTVKVDVEGAEVSVDDAVVGTSPLSKPVLVNAGKRKISAKIAGKPAATRVITVAGADAVTVELELAEPKTKSATTTSEKPAPGKGVPASQAPREIPWVAWGVTGGLAVAAGVSGIVAWQASSDLEARRDAPGASRAELDDASSRTKTWALVTDVLLVGTLASAAVSTWLTLDTKPTKTDRAATTVRVGIGPTGFALAGTF